VRLGPAQLRAVLPQLEEAASGNSRSLPGRARDDWEMVIPMARSPPGVVWRNEAYGRYVRTGTPDPHIGTAIHFVELRFQKSAAENRAIKIILLITTARFF